MIIKTNKKLLGYKKDSIINLNNLRHLEKTYFLRRLKDAKIDNCVEIYKEKKVNKNDTINIES